MKNASKIVRAAVRCFLCVLVFLLVMPYGTGLAADAPYYTLTQDYNGKLIYTQDGYLPTHTFWEIDGKSLKRASDFCIDEFDYIYIADTGNKRVVKTDLLGNHILTFGKGLLSKPEGVFVRDQLLYVADSKLKQIVIFNAETGEELSAIEHPQTALYGVKVRFKPTKVAVDSSHGVYVISSGNTNGIAQFSSDGTFLGYFGANSTEISLAEKIKRLIYTEEQLASLKKNVPSAATALDMDEYGLIYTVTSGRDNGGLRKFNMAGIDIFPSISIGFTQASDVCVGSLENVFVLSQTGYIIEYSREGRALFFFGGQDVEKNRDGMFVSAAAIDTDSHDNLYVLDSEKNKMQVFSTTEYARLVHEALRLYQEGQYAASRGPWESVLQLNTLFDYAQMGLGHAYYKLGMYSESLQAHRLGGDKSGYSDAFWEVRNIFLQDNILWIFGALILLSVLKAALRTIRKKTHWLSAADRVVHRVKNLRIIRELRYIFYVPRNPADAFYGIKLMNSTSYLSASILYILFFAIFVVDKYFSGFLFLSVQEGSYELGADIALVFGMIGLFLISCNLICSIRDGEATLGQIFKGLAYALMPYLLLKPISILLSYVLTYNEAFLISMLDGAIIFLCFALIVVLIREMQCFSYRQTFMALFLTAVTMLLLVVGLIIVFTLIAQLYEFISAIVKEASYFYET